MSPEELKKARAALRCTAKELALALELAPTTVAAWERGDEFPTKKLVERIAAMVEVGPTAIPRKAKGQDPLAALHDPDVWMIFRKILTNPKLRAEVMHMAEKYEDPA